MNKLIIYKLKIFNLIINYTMFIMFCELRRFIFSTHKFLLLNFFIYNEIISLQYINYIDEFNERNFLKF